MFNRSLHIREYLCMYPWKKLTKLSNNCYKPAENVKLSCCNTRNSNYVVAATPEATTP